MYCNHCGKEIQDGAEFCSFCGWAQNRTAGAAAPGIAVTPQGNALLAPILITVFLGGLGIHRFMAGKVGTGVLWLLTGGCFGIGWLVDLIMVCTGKFLDANGNLWVV